MTRNQLSERNRDGGIKKFGQPDQPGDGRQAQDLFQWKVAEMQDVASKNSKFMTRADQDSVEQIVGTRTKTLPF